MPSVRPQRRENAGIGAGAVAAVFPALQNLGCLAEQCHHGAALRGADVAVGHRVQDLDVGGRPPGLPLSPFWNRVSALSAASGDAAAPSCAVTPLSRRPSVSSSSMTFKPFEKCQKISKNMPRRPDQGGAASMTESLGNRNIRVNQFGWTCHCYFGDSLQCPLLRPLLQRPSRCRRPAQRCEGRARA